MRIRSTKIMAMVVFAASIPLGCVGQPFLADSLGLLPGPSLDLLGQTTTGSALLDQLLAAGLDANSISSLTGSTTTTDANSTTQVTDANSTTDEHNCAAGEVWVGTVTVNGIPITVNACVPESQASLYGAI
jgi:hypothetical protein